MLSMHTRVEVHSSKVQFKPADVLIDYHLHELLVLWSDFELHFLLRVIGTKLFNRLQIQGISRQYLHGESPEFVLDVANLIHHQFDLGSILIQYGFANEELVRQGLIA